MNGEKLLIQTNTLNEVKRLELIKAIVSVLERTNVSYEWLKKEEPIIKDCISCNEKLDNAGIENVCEECFRNSNTSIN